MESTGWTDEVAVLPWTGEMGVKKRLSTILRLKMHEKSFVNVSSTEE